MKIKHLIFIVIIMTAVLASLFIGTRSISLRVFSELEHADMDKNVTQVKNALAAELQKLSTIAGEYLGSDEAHKLALRGNRALEINNFDTAFYVRLRLNLIVYINRSGAIVYGHLYDFHTKQELSIPQPLVTALKSRWLFNPLFPNSASSGFWQLPDGIMLIASRPVLTGDGQGPAMGTMIVGRYLDAAEVKRLSDLTQFELQVNTAAQVADSPALQAIRRQLSGVNSVYVNPLNKELIVGAVLLQDIYGKDAGLLQVVEPRHTLKANKEATSYFFRLYFVTSAAFLIVFSLLSWRLILARRRDIHMSNHLKDSEEQYRSLFESALTGNFIATPDCRVVLCNEAFARIMGYSSVEEVLSVTAIDFFPCKEQKENCQARLKQLGKIEFMEFEMNRKDGTKVSTIGNIDGVFDEDGNLVQVRGYLLDATEKKQAMERIQHMNDQLAQLVEEVSCTNAELETRVNERTAALKESHEEMKKVSFQLVWAEERERERIAGELHDHIGQSLLLAKMKLDVLSNDIPEAALRVTAEEASSLLETSIKEVRTLTIRMRPPILNTAGIETALEWLCSSVSGDYSIQIEFTDDRLPKPLPAELRYSLYQAVRELLLNVIKHARTDKAQLSINVDNHALIVRVIDYGVGFDCTDANSRHLNGDGYGLYNVQQRIEQIGGNFAIESQVGKGTTVTVKVPLAESGS